MIENHFPKRPTHAHFVSQKKKKIIFENYGYLRVVSQESGFSIQVLTVNKLDYFYILHRAEALQSMVMLYGERELYEYYRRDYIGYEWSLEKARDILQAWQRKFTQVWTRNFGFMSKICKIKNKNLISDLRELNGNASKYVLNQSNFVRKCIEFVSYFWFEKL